MLNFSRKNNLLGKLLITDGISGAGKIIIDDFLSTFYKIEILNVSSEFENITIIKHLKKIDSDAYEVFIKILLDMLLYNTFMSRGVNFRPSDQTGVLRSQKIMKYFLRLFNKGNKKIPSIIEKSEPCLRLMTHSILGYSEPLFQVLGDKLILIDFRRHPLMILKTIFNNNKSYQSQNGIISRQFKIYSEYNDIDIPYWALDNADKYVEMNTIDQSIFEIYTKTKNSNNFISNNTEIYRRQCLNIPFEFFVQNPIYFLNKIKKLLQDDYSGTKKLIKKYNIPREEELTTSAKEDIFQFAKNENASKESILLLKKLSNEYDSFLNNFSYEN